MNHFAKIAEKLSAYELDGMLLKEYDALWDTITVDFGEIGYVTNDKDNISIEDYALWWETTKAEGENENNPLRRYFIPNNFKLQSHS